MSITKRRFRTKITLPDTDFYVLFAKEIEPIISLSQLIDSTDYNLIHIRNLPSYPSEYEGFIKSIELKSNLNLVCFISLFDHYLELACSLNKILSLKNEINLLTYQRISKAGLYKALKIRGLPMVNYLVIDDIRNKDFWIKKIQDKFHNRIFLMKPSQGMDSDGVCKSRLKEKPAETLERYQKSLGRFNASGLDYTKGEHIAMEYIHYKDKSIEICVDGIFVDKKIQISVSEKVSRTDKEPFWDTLMVSPPISELVLAAEKKIEKILLEVFTEIGIEQSIFHAEFRFGSIGPVLIDLSLRPGGGFISHAIEIQSNVNLYIEYINSIFSKINLKKMGRRKHGTAIGAVYKEVADEIELLEILEYLKRSKEVFAYHANLTFTNDQISMKECIMSLGVLGNSPQDALNNYKVIMQDCGLLGSPI